MSSDDCDLSDLQKLMVHHQLLGRPRLGRSPGDAKELLERAKTDLYQDGFIIRFGRNLGRFGSQFEVDYSPLNPKYKKA